MTIRRRTITILATSVITALTLAGCAGGKGETTMPKGTMADVLDSLTSGAESSLINIDASELVLKARQANGNDDPLDKDVVGYLAVCNMDKETALYESRLEKIDGLPDKGAKDDDQYFLVTFSDNTGALFTIDPERVTLCQDNPYAQLFTPGTDPIRMSKQDGMWTYLPGPVDPRDAPSSDPATDGVTNDETGAAIITPAPEEEALPAGEEQAPNPEEQAPAPAPEGEAPAEQPAEQPAN